MSAPWRGRHVEPWWLRVLLLPLDLVALLYGAAAALHRALYRRGWLAVRRLPCRVVSVGGISAGGSGKTPLAAWIARRLREQGHRVSIASRGYVLETGQIVLHAPASELLTNDAVQKAYLGG